MIASQKPRLLLDTNIVTYTLKNTKWKELYEPILFGKRLCISFMTFAELLEGAYRKQLSARNLRKYQNDLWSRYVTISSNDTICECFANIRVQRRTRPISVPDALIAATAMAYELPLVTHNAKDFAGIDGLKLVTCYEKQE